MNNWQRALVSPSATLRSALEAINEIGCQMALVVDEQRRLLGTLSDGDARRGFLRGLSLDDPVASVMHRSPTVATAADDRQARLALMRRLGLHQLPLVDDANVVIGLVTLDDFLSVPAREEWVVIMAGGLGSRLKELTRDTPKPMLRVGSRPLLETIVRSYADQGFRRFYFAVNYKAEQIERHFGDGSMLGVQIRYLREQQRLGTAGALSLLPERPAVPLFVTNADLLTKEDIASMVDRHVEANVDATMGVRKYEMQVPFGVVKERNGHFEGIVEKPIQHFTVSAGMYVLSPSALELVPRNTYFDMPNMFEALIDRGLRVRCHNVSGYWLDVGQAQDYERANLEFAEVFR